MFHHPKILQPSFLYPNLNILKIWACDELWCQSYESKDTPYPLHDPIVRQVFMSKYNFFVKQTFF